MPPSDAVEADPFRGLSPVASAASLMGCGGDPFAVKMTEEEDAAGAARGEALDGAASTC